MRYYRCKCGKCTAWSTMGVESCAGCDECKTTLAEGPDGHSEIAPHDWREEFTIDPETGRRGKERVCFRCMTRESVMPAEFTIYVDDRPVVLPARDATGIEIKIAGRIDPLFSLHSIDHPGMQPIADDKRISLVDGARFMTAPPGHF